MIPRVLSVWLTVLLFTVVHFGCATTSGTASSITYRVNLGTVWFDQIPLKVPNILVNRLNYEIFTSSINPTHIWYVTDWKSRVPFHDERLVGALEARTRIRVEGRVRGRGTIMDATANRGSVVLYIENSIRLGDGQWVGVDHTDEFQKYIQYIERELRRELIPQEG